MGRSVSVPRDAEVFYLDLSEMFEREEWDENDWDWLQEAIVDSFMQWPSVETAEEWIGREDHVLAKNGLAKFGISTYCNIASVWVVPIEEGHNQYGDRIDITDLSKNWIAKTWPKVKKRWPNRMERGGTMSNGVSFYRKVED
tara:strand:- start:1950 stop:2375 length:426 start_codon:yes stop_codon:yes gene_type:complete